MNMARQEQAPFLEDDPNVAQQVAADPNASVWVGASAGTGKTKVLTDRVLRLMLPQPDGRPGTLAHRILCITFTNIGASEMKSRISDRLSQWAVMPKDKLYKDLQDLTGGTVSLQMYNEARRLFARVVDVPGGMKIMTIHSFCESVLKRFPLEANISPHFGLVDDRTARQYLRDAVHNVLFNLSEESDLSVLTTLLNSDRMTELAEALVRERYRLSVFFLEHDQTLDSVVYDFLGAQPGVTKDVILKLACRDESFDVTGLRQACGAMCQDEKTDIADMQAWLDSTGEERVEMFEAWRNIFFTKDNKPRKKLLNKKMAEKYPDLLDILSAERDRVLLIDKKIKAHDTARLTTALLKVGKMILQSYEKRKSDAGELDYDDLIYKTLDLLNRSNFSGWVLYKLDGGLDHILVDEAQDTNPEQWQIIKALTDDFYSGKNAHDDVERTVFVVGDEKQSIFSFQRADPRKFSNMQNYFASQVESSKQKWQAVDLQTSFRSSPVVLRAIDQIFAQDHVRQGLVVDREKKIYHQARHAKRGGRVELWPLIEVEKPAPEIWPLPSSESTVNNPKAVLAKKIADTIKEWVDTGERLESQGRPVHPGDILILVRSRAGGLVDHLVRELKSNNIPVAGVDRMRLTEQLSVMDLLCLAQFLLMPNDDLNLATLLKTPIIGLDEDDLFDLSWNRPGCLWDEVQKKQKNIARYLKDLQSKVDFITAYELFSTVLKTPCPADSVSGQRAIQSRLGHDAIDPLNEFLNAVLEFEHTEFPSLQKFIDWFYQGDTDIKREMDASHRKDVRIMTVHGAKGLESPIVFLPDTTSLPGGGTKEGARLLWPENILDPPLWVPRKDLGCDMYHDRAQQDKSLQMQEYKRLLYVALTRAKERLYICGYKGDNKIPDSCWYALMEEALGAGATLVQEQEDFVAPSQGDVEDDLRVTLPNWALSAAPREEKLSRPLMPSRPFDMDSTVASPLDVEKDAQKLQRFYRGIIVHRLLDLLPNIDPIHRETACRRFLNRPSIDLASAEKENLTEEILSVLSHPDFALVFGPGSRAEVPLTGRIGDYVLSGQIDRLVVTEDEVLIVDYKTNRPPPHKVSDVDEMYMRQMSAYRAIIQRIYPDKPVRCGLLWTYGPDFMELPAEALDVYHL